jgi:hypothetical protein
MEEVKEANQKKEKEKELFSDKVDELLGRLEEEESSRVGSQEDILEKMQENPLGTLAAGALIGAALVYFYNKRAQQRAIEQEL